MNRLNPETLLAVMVAGAPSLGCPAKETPGPAPEPTPAPTVAQSTLCRETQMISGAPVSYCFEVAFDGAKTPMQCPDNIDGVPFCP